MVTGINYTQIPWHMEKSGKLIISNLGLNENGIMQIRTIGRVFSNAEQAENEANGEFIVRAVNSHDILLDTIKYAQKACQCERFPSRKMKRGFDYGEEHPVLGKCETGARWLTPKDKIDAILNLLGA